MIAVCILSLLFSITACSNSKADPNAGGKKVIKFWTFGSAGYEKLAQEYMKTHKDVEIQVQSAEFNDHHNKLFTALSAGSGAPDLAMIEVGFIEKYRDAQDRFHNLYDLGAADIKSQYLDWKWSIGESSDGKFLFGLPTDIGPTVMFYRTDVFQAAGLPTDPEEVAKQIRTWDDFVKAARQVKEKTGKPMLDSLDLVFNAKKDQAPESFFNRNDELIIEKSPYAKDAYLFASQMIKEGLVGQLEMFTPEWGASMKSGNYGAILGASWMVANIKGNAPESKGKWGVAPMPEGAGNWGGSYLAIPKESKNYKEAYEFAKWLVSPENQLRSFKENGLFPSALEVYEKKEFMDYRDDFFVNEKLAPLFADAARSVKKQYTGKHYFIVQGELIQALRNVQSKKADPEAEWGKAVERIKKQIARQ